MFRVYFYHTHTPGTLAIGPRLKVRLSLPLVHNLRGCGEGRASRLLRASSSSWSRWRLERRGRREDRIFFLCVRTKSAHLPNEAVFSGRSRSFGYLSNTPRELREAGTPPRSPRFKWRAGTPHLPLHQPSGTESMIRNRSARALVCELQERATRPPR